jgi:mRNA-degrading endonuclease RelE of RelBE toxin-antitoxin system
MTEGEIDDLVDFLAANPTAGVEIAGTGGCRKVRFAGRGKGKSGGYRIITFYIGARLPVFLITVFSKGDAPIYPRPSPTAFGLSPRPSSKNTEEVAGVARER